MKDTEKRTVNITLHLTPQEAELLEVLAELDQRKPSEKARLLMNKAALQEWTKKQIEAHDPNIEPLTPLKF